MSGPRWFSRDHLERFMRETIVPVKRILDVGSGIRPQDFFKAERHVCVEPYWEYVEILKLRGDHTPGFSVWEGLAQDILPSVGAGAFDSVFLMDVIEHLEKEDGVKLLAECERIARKQVIVFTPLGFLPQNYVKGEQDGWGLHGGEWQHHRSGWVPEDFGPKWAIYACGSYHSINGKGEALNPPAGAFYAVLTKE